jgi:hypothetical protein
MLIVKSSDCLHDENHGISTLVDEQRERGRYCKLERGQRDRARSRAPRRLVMTSVTDDDCRVGAFVQKLCR